MRRAEPPGKPPEGRAAFLCRFGKGDREGRQVEPPASLGVEKAGRVTKKAVKNLVNFTPFL